MKVSIWNGWLNDICFFDTIKWQRNLIIKYFLRYLMNSEMFHIYTYFNQSFTFGASGMIDLTYKSFYIRSTFWYLLFIHKGAPISNQCHLHKCHKKGIDVSCAYFKHIMRKWVQTEMRISVTSLILLHTWYDFIGEYKPHTDIMNWRVSSVSIECFSEINFNSNDWHLMTFIQILHVHSVKKKRQQMIVFQQ